MSKKAQLLQTLHSAFTFVRSIETNRAVSSITLDHLIQEQISSLKKGEETELVDGKGNTVQKKYSRWDQLDILEKDLESVIKSVRDAGDDPEKLADLGLHS